MSLHFRQAFPNGDHARSILTPHGPWWQGNVVVNEVQHVGMVCFRMGGRPLTLVSTFKQPGNNKWGPCKLAIRTKPGAPPQEETITDIDLAAMWGAQVLAPTPDPEIGPDPKQSDITHLPIKNTFIHYDAPNSFVEWHSAPNVMLHESFKLKITPIQKAHLEGACRPCLYFHLKKDGCRKGKNCEFCHTCDSEEIRKVIREKERARKRVRGG